MGKRLPGDVPATEERRSFQTWSVMLGSSQDTNADKITGVGAEDQITQKRNEQKHFFSR